MRHKNSGRKFDRNTSSRRAMFRNLAANLVLHEKIETTDAKAKELRRVAERLITRAKRLGKVAYTKHDDLSPVDRAKRLAATRVVGSYVTRWGTKIEGDDSQKVDLVEKIFCDLARRYAERPGGYTRIIKAGPRRGDGAQMAYIELVEGEVSAKAEAGEKKGKKAGKAQAGAKLSASGTPKKATAAAPKESAKAE
ncbi:MAG: 50S ribosomal protein L17 [Polyangiaceae bacterium]